MKGPTGVWPAFVDRPSGPKGALGCRSVTPAVLAGREVQRWLLREGWLASARRGHYEHYTSTNEEKRESEDNIVWHNALCFLRSRASEVYSLGNRTTRGALIERRSPILAEGHCSPGDRRRRSCGHWSRKGEDVAKRAKR
jgi:hypothetical protein